MTAEQNIIIAQTFLQRLANPSSAPSVVELFAEDLLWNIPGNEAAYPWIGQQHGKDSVTRFISESGKRLQRTLFEIHDILANERRAMIYGGIAAIDLVTEKSMATPFIIVLDISEGLITSFLMMENGVAVSEASEGAK
ncbi:nuclear transport factor 2 family protein [Erwinia sp. 9145]|uniref:nuclear transport factor 2 family protein n=1 Tax=Erwinia sp. 9145 TaxID=1500895 RepID=UPI000691C264|nr:nuclear transport factor 2 family protein [Erwinia sp. 9145]